jgi:tetratricopeptide (TPR) repeat protein
MANTERAFSFFQEALKIREKHEDRKGIADILNNIGMIEALRNHEESALQYYQRSLELQEALGERQKQSNVYNNIGNVLEVLGRNEESLASHRKALELRVAIGDPRGQLNSMLNIGNCYFNAGDIDLAERTIREIIPKAEELGSKNLILNIAERMMAIAEMKNEWENAYRWARRSLIEQRSVIGEDRIQSISEALAEYLTSEKEKEAEVLRQKNQELEASYAHLEQAQDEIVALEKRNAVLAMSVTANHELNQPLMVAMGNLEMLMSTMADHPVLSDYQMRYLSRIEEALTRISHILDKFRHVSNFFEADYSQLTKMIVFPDDGRQYQCRLPYLHGK